MTSAATAVRPGGSEPPGQPAWTGIILMSAWPAECGDGHDVIHLGDETAVVVPLQEYGMLAALRKRASAEEIAEAEADAAIAEHEAWKAGGGPAAPSLMRLPWPNCSAASEDRLAARRADVRAPVHGRSGRDAGHQRGSCGLSRPSGATGCLRPRHLLQAARRQITGCCTR